MFTLNQPLIKEFSSPSSQKLSRFNEIGHPGLYLQRMDYALSCLIGTRKHNYQQALQLRYEGELLEYLTLMNELGYLGRYGRTVNPASYLVNFPDIEVTYLWLPKNACTNTKKIFAGIYPEHAGQLRPHQFHETFQTVFGLEHKGVNTLVPAIQSMLNAKLVFCVIRDPIERLISCYVDKFVKPIWMDRPFEGFIESYIKSTIKALGLDRQVRASITFREFVYSLMIAENWSLDSHWRPQSDFIPSKSVRNNILFLDVKDTGSFFSELFDYLETRHPERFKTDSWQHKEDKRANSSLGKNYGRQLKATGKCTDFLPIQYSREDIKDYNDYPDSCIVNSLAKLYEGDYELRDRICLPEQFSSIIIDRFA